MRTDNILVCYQNNKENSFEITPVHCLNRLKHNMVPINITIPVTIWHIVYVYNVHGSCFH